MKKVVVLFLLLATMAYGDIVIANSADWHDIYSAGIYSALEGHEFRFLISQKHSELLIPEVRKPNIIVIEDEKRAFVKGYANRLTTQGYNATSLIIRDANTELLDHLNTNKYIVIDPAFGYDAVSALPFATYTEHYPLFVDRTNINELIPTLENAENIIILGQIDPLVEEQLTEYQPEIINEGSRFKNNILLAERYRASTDAKQAILTNGEFLEVDMFRLGKERQPIIFIGEDRPPEETMQYLRGAGLETAVLIGNELAGSAKQIKDILNIPVFVKFAKGTTSGGGLFKDVQGLDTYPLPILDPQLALVGMYYNTEEKQLQLMLENNRSFITHARPTISVIIDGELFETVGEEESAILPARSMEGFTYENDLTEHIAKNLTAQILVPYGPAAAELTRTIDTQVPIQIIGDADTCAIDIKNARYDKRTQRFHITLTSQEPCYAQTQIQNLIIADEITNTNTPTVLVDDETTIEIKQRMDEVDLADNKQITIEVRHGAREDLLIDVTRKTLPLKSATINYYLIIALIAIIIFGWILWRKKR